VSAAERVPILVAGGGIGGLAVALALANRGLRVRVIEKASEFAELGAGLQLAPNASRALDALGVCSAIESFAVFPQRMIWMDAISGEEVTSLDLGAPFLERYRIATSSCTAATSWRCCSRPAEGTRASRSRRAKTSSRWRTESRRPG
jgi:2-polyprenyl-6-methoxyphenol hydroxylase-like FAD-dependent oxidoreductase